MERSTGLRWPGVLRLGLVQMAIGAAVVLMTSTLNRVMVVEIGLPAVVPGALVALHFAMQLSRPHMGFGSDMGGRRTPWIVGGMVLLGVSAIGAALATALMATHAMAGIVLAVVAFAALGVGVSASSTPFLALLAERVEVRRQPGAAALTWILMIVGIIITAGVAGALLDPFTPGRLVTVTAGVSACALVLTLLGVWRNEPASPDAYPGRSRAPAGAAAESSFGAAFRQLWADDEARRFAVFVFVSMLAYSAQDIILEPFAGAVFGLTPGESTQVAGLQHGGVLVGMAIAAIGAARRGDVRVWSAAGCLASAVCFGALTMTALAGGVGAMKTVVFSLGLANGVFAVGAIAAMMGLVNRGGAGRAGLRMGFWGAAQAVAYGAGGLAGAALSDAARWMLGSPAAGYGAVFLLEAVLFAASATLVLRGVSPVRSRALDSGLAVAR